MTTFWCLHINTIISQHQFKVAIAMADEQPCTVESARFNGTDIWREGRKKEGEAIHIELGI